MTTAKTSEKFDLIDGLVQAGFGREEIKRMNGYKRTKLTKHYEKVQDAVWYPNHIHSFDVEVWCTWYHGEVVNVHVQYANGKVKDHAYGKRAYNAIRDTVKYNGFEL